MAYPQATLQAAPSPSLRDADRDGAVLTSTVERLSTADSVERVTQIVAGAARDLMAADGATFVLREDDRCFYADESAIGPLWKGSRFPLSACISGWAMQHRETVLIPDIYADSRIPHDAYRPTFVRSLAMAPIRQESPIGAVGAYWSDHRTPTREEVRLLEVLANSAAVALENLELRGAVGRRAAERDELETAIHTLVHDLKGPLGAMLGYAELIEDGVDDAERVRTFAQTIRRAGARLDEQIERMLGIYRITNTQLAPSSVDLTLMASDIAEEVTSAAEHDVDVQIEDAMVAELDPTLGHLLVRNLLDNAVKYTRRASRPQVRFRRIEAGSPLSTFVVEDNGVGFDPAHAGRLFQPLGRLHSDTDFPGTGLGLASVARIVHLHGGKIRAEGRVGEGAAFYLGLPVPASA